MLKRWRPVTATLGALACLAALSPGAGAAGPGGSTGTARPAPATSAAPAALSPSTDAALAARQCVAAADFVHVVGQGDLCRRAGATMMRLQSGQRMSVSAPDSAAVLAAGTQAAAPAPAPNVPLLPAQCVDPATHQHVELYYARFSDQPDRSATFAADIQQQFRDVDVTYLNYDAAHYFGTGARLFAECDGSRNPVVHTIALSTPLASSDFNSIANDMYNQGHSNPRAHYWIWTDGNPAQALGYAGQSSLEDDDSPSAANLINRSYEYSVNYAYQGTAGSRIFAHENGHAMGAVQLSAPHTTGGFHCVDGLDVMCYSDGGPTGNLYTTGSCALAPNGTAIFDCNFDDYFNPAPAAGTYLSTHWNIANPNNGWLLLQPAATTTAVTASASTVVPNQQVLVTARATPPAGTGGTPSGTVSFYDGGTLVATRSLGAGGSAQYATSALTAGMHTLSATFAGSSVYTSSTSAGAAVIVLTGNQPPAGIHPAVIDSAGHGAAALAVDDSHIYARLSDGNSFGAPTVRSTNLFYGSRATLFANLDGPGQPASAVAINDNSIFVMKNTGGSFGAVQQWSYIPFYGTRSTVLADVDGSGRASAVAINDNSIWVMHNNGSAFDAPVQWSSSPFYGARATIMAVVTAGGRASPVAINDNSIWVMANTGSGTRFAAPSLRSSFAFYGSRGTFLADMDGSGIASAVAVNDSTIWVMHNDGTAFTSPTAWSSEPFYGTWLYLADVDGSGRASPVAVSPGGTWVKRNSGGTLGPATSWLPGAYYGNR
jgi:hypothetical protein